MVIRKHNALAIVVADLRASKYRTYRFKIFLGNLLSDTNKIEI
jgi:hypothetical protein